jgi:4-hydroxybenzoate polyprenyltransferase
MLSRLWLIPSFLRLPNLLLVFLTQAIPYWCVLRPAIIKSGGIPVLNERTFGLLALATVLTTLAGYIINDYFDRDIDAINRPNEVVVGRWISPAATIVFYWGLQAFVTLLSYLLFLDMPKPHGYWSLWLFPTVSLLLFLYAWQLKCTPFVGNLLVALLCGVTPLIMLVPESRPLWLASFPYPREIRVAMGIVWMYGLFALVTNLFREQIKDLEDVQGDAACRCNTTPVLRGVRFAKKTTGVTGFIVCFMMVLLLVFWQDNMNQEWRIGAGVVLLLFPAIVSMFLVFSAKDKRDFSRASLALKITMLAGIFLLLPYWPSTKNEWLSQWTQFRVWSSVLLNGHP